MNIEATQAEPEVLAPEGDSVHEAVVAAFKTHEPEVGDGGEALGDAASQEGQSAEARARDASGRFAPKDKAPEAAPDGQAAAPDGQEGAPAAPAQPAAEAPASWTAEAKADWEKVPPAVQAVVAKREAEINEAGRRWSEEKRSYLDILGPADAMARASGMSAKDGVAAMMAVETALRSPQTAAAQVAQLIQIYGVDPGAVAEALGKGGQVNVPGPDPQIQALQQELAELRQGFSSREEAEIGSEISAFAAANPHFEAVRGQMGRLMEAGLAATLQEAYDQAVWSTPGLRTQMIAGQDAQRRQQQEAAERERAQRARNAAVSISGSPATPGASQAGSFDTPEDAVRDAYARHAGRA